MSPKKYSLPKRFHAALSEKAYENLRVLNEKFGYGNNYLLTILLENINEITDENKLEQVFNKFKEEYGAPSVGKMKA